MRARSSPVVPFGHGFSSFRSSRAPRVRPSVSYPPNRCLSVTSRNANVASENSISRARIAPNTTALPPYAPAVFDMSAGRIGSDPGCPYDVISTDAPDAGP
jgi:hypothetical protein